MAGEKFSATHNFPTHSRVLLSMGPWMSVEQVSTMSVESSCSVTGRRDDFLRSSATVGTRRRDLIRKQLSR